MNHDTVTHLHRENILKTRMKDQVEYRFHTKYREDHKVQTVLIILPNLT